MRRRTPRNEKKAKAGRRLRVKKSKTSKKSKKR